MEPTAAEKETFLKRYSAIDVQVSRMQPNGDESMAIPSYTCALTGEGGHLDHQFDKDVVGDFLFETLVMSDSLAHSTNRSKEDQNSYVLMRILMEPQGTPASGTSNVTQSTTATIPPTNGISKIFAKPNRFTPPVTGITHMRYTNFFNELPGIQRAPAGCNKLQWLDFRFVLDSFPVLKRAKQPIAPVREFLASQPPKVALVAGNRVNMQVEHMSTCVTSGTSGEANRDRSRSPTRLPNSWETSPGLTIGFPNLKGDIVYKNAPKTPRYLHDLLPSSCPYFGCVLEQTPPVEIAKHLQNCRDLAEKQHHPSFAAVSVCPYYTNHHIKRTYLFHHLNHCPFNSGLLKNLERPTSVNTILQDMQASALQECENHDDTVINPDIYLFHPKTPRNYFISKYLIMEKDRDLFNFVDDDRLNKEFEVKDEKFWIEAYQINYLDYNH